MDRPWFASKRYGVGSGWPIAWQGWALVVLFTAALLSIQHYAPQRLKVWLTCILVIGFVVVVAGKTEGGWRWRWGGKD